MPIIAIRANFLQLRQLLARPEVQPYVGAYPSCNIFLMLGNTLGNLQESEMVEELKRSTRPGDIVIFSLEFASLFSGENATRADVLANYETEALQNLFGSPLIRLFEENRSNGRVHYEYVDADTYSNVPNTKSVVVRGWIDGKLYDIVHSNRYDERSFIGFMESYGFGLLGALPENSLYKYCIFSRYE